MTGRRFSMILDELHACPLDTLTSFDPGYSPIMKIQELKDALEHRFCLLYKPGRNIFIDKILLHAYGKIDFKV